MAPTCDRGTTSTPWRSCGALRAGRAIGGYATDPRPLWLGGLRPLAGNGRSTVTKEFARTRLRRPLRQEPPFDDQPSPISTAPPPGGRCCAATPTSRLIRPEHPPHFDRLETTPGHALTAAHDAVLPSGRSGPRPARRPRDVASPRAAGAIRRSPSPKPSRPTPARAAMAAPRRTSSTRRGTWRVTSTSRK